MSVKRVSVYTVGRQPCQAFLRGDSNSMHLGEGNRANVHECPSCSGRRAWCDNCHADHHEHGWETCAPDAYRVLEYDSPVFGRPEWIDPPNPPVIPDSST